LFASNGDQMKEKSIISRNLKVIFFFLVFAFDRIVHGEAESN